MAIAGPQPFGKYILLNKIALGGMAEIFRAKTIGAEGFQKEVVIKRILPHFTEDEAFVTMFIDEAKIASGLNHPNIVQIYDFDTIEDTYYIAMEYIEGKDLKRVVDTGTKVEKPLTVEQVVWSTMEVCKGLHYAHTKTDRGKPLNIVHRDVSPHNVMVSYDGEVKIMDFGIAKAAARSTKTRAGTVKGKCAYMSPEQARGKPLDARSDLFAVGVMMWEMLTHKRLFAGESDFETLSNVLKADVPPARTINPAVPEDLDAILLKALAKNRDERWDDCKAFMRALQGWFYQSVTDPEAAELRRYMQNMFAEDIAALRQMQQADAHVNMAEASAIVRAHRPSSTSHPRLGSQSGVAAVPTNDARTIALDVSQGGGMAPGPAGLDPSSTGHVANGDRPKSRTGLWIGLTVGLAVAGVGGFFGYQQFMGKNGEAKPTATAKAPTRREPPRPEPSPTPSKPAGDPAEPGKPGGVTPTPTGPAVVTPPTTPPPRPVPAKPPAPTKVKVTFTIAPADAEIEVLGTGKKAKGRVEAEVTVGTMLSVIARHPDYENLIVGNQKVERPGQLFAMAMTKKKATAPPPTPPKAPVPTAVVLPVVTVTVSPDDATLTANGAPQSAVSPGVFRVTGFPTGTEVELKASRSKYHTATKRLKLEGPAEAVAISLKKREDGPGTVSFSASPWANVSAGGKSCRTRCSMTLKAGSYTATFSQGGKTKRRGFKIRPGKSTSVHMDMLK